MPPRTASATAVCECCGEPFSYELLRGNRRRQCDRCRRPRKQDAPREYDVDLHALPALIQAQEAAGHPVIVERAPGSLQPHEERLYATLGVLVRFVDPPTGAA